MNPVLFTLYEKDYHYGVAALVNSAIRHGFEGPVCVFHRGPKPPWTERLGRDGDQYRVGKTRLAFHEIDPPRHLGYHKPKAALEVLRLYPECDALIYADPDIVFLAPWTFYDNWMSHGVALCLDSHFGSLPDEHPWRVEWKRLLEKAGLASFRGTPYANAGFLALMREHRRLLEIWEKVTDLFEAEGNDTTRYYMEDRYRPVVGDQDTLAMALQGWDGPRSVLGPEAMGFTGYHFILSHDIDSPKAWSRPFVRRALSGYPPGRAGGLYLEYANAPIAAWAPEKLAQRKAAYRLAQLITRVWKR